MLLSITAFVVLATISLLFHPAATILTQSSLMFRSTTTTKWTRRQRHDKATKNVKTLLLLRHAKPSWDSNNNNHRLSDFDRPLADAGRQAARRLGRFLAQHQVTPPQVIFCSPSVRTRQTLDLVRREQGWAIHIPVVFDPRLYNFDQNDPAAYMDFVTSLHDSRQRVLIVGHNPPLGALAYNLLELSSNNQTTAAVNKFLPAAFCEIDWPNLERWRDLEYGQGRLGMILQPNDFHWRQRRPLFD